MADVGFTIGGDNSEFLAAIKDSQTAVAQASAAIRDTLRGVSGSFQQVTEHVHGIGGALEEINGKIQGAFEFVGLAAGLEVMEKVGAAIEKISEEARKISTDSQVLGVSVEQYQAMQHAAEEAGVGIDTLTHAAEKLELMLNEARNGSSSAIDKLLTLGVTTRQIHDPLFTVIDLLGVEKERLENGSTAVEARNALLQVLGTRMASAIGVMKEFEGSQEGVQRSTNQTNAYSEQQIERLKEVGAWWGNVGTWAERAAGKALVAAADLTAAAGKIHTAMMEDASPEQQAEALGPDQGQSTSAAKQASKAREQINDGEQHEWQVMQQEMLGAELKALQLGLAASKEGSAQKLAYLREYARVASELYGEQAPDVQKANEKVLAEQRVFNEQQKQGMQELQGFDAEINNSIAELRSRVALDSARYTAESVKQQEKDIKDLQSLEETGRELENSAAKLQAENVKRSADYNKQIRADFERQYKGIADTITNSVSGALTNMITHTKSFQQEMASIFQSLVGGVIKHFVQMGVQWVETQAENLIVGNATAKAQGEALAGQAGAAGVASFAAAPWPIDLGAAGFGAAMYAEAQSFAVAEHGYDVPAGINPMTQLHAREMVLPANLADTVRGMAAAGGGGREEHHTYTGDLNVSHADLRQLIGNRTAQRQLTKELSKAYRRGVRP